MALNGYLLVSGRVSRIVLIIISYTKIWGFPKIVVPKNG